MFNESSAEVLALGLQQSQQGIFEGITHDLVLVSKIWKENQRERLTFRKKMKIHRKAWYTFWKFLRIALGKLRKLQ